MREKRSDDNNLSKPLKQRSGQSSVIKHSRIGFTEDGFSEYHRKISR